MKKIYTVILILNLLISCKSEKEITYINQNLLNEIDNHIDYFTKFRSGKAGYDKNAYKSIWVVFYKDSSSCEVSIITNFNNYNSKIMNGYFYYGEKIVSVYGIEKGCGESFVDKDFLLKGRIDSLYCYEDEDFIHCPHNPMVFRYNIEKGNKLKLFYKHNKYVQ